MTLRLRDGTKLVFARGRDPGRLVRGGVRFILDGIEEKMAAVLVDGASDEELAVLLSQSRVGWDREALICFVKKMRKAGLLVEGAESVDDERYDGSAETELMLAEDLPAAIEPPGSEDTLAESTEQVTKVESPGRLSQELEVIADGAVEGTDQVIHGMPARKKIKAPTLRPPDRPQQQRGHRSSLIVMAVIVLLLVNGALALHLIEVPRPTRLACRVAGVPLARALTPIDGEIISTRATGGQQVAKGAALAVVEDRGRARRLAALDRGLAREEANLRSMSRPCAKKRLRRLARRQRALRRQRARQARRCRRSNCPVRLARIDASIDAARRAYEICHLGKRAPAARAVQLRLDRLRTQRGVLVFKPVQALISSPAAGLACEILPLGRPLSWGSPVATICDPRRLWATARYSGDAPAVGAPVQVVLGTGATALEGKTEATAAGEIRIIFPGAAARYLHAAHERCELELELGTMPLWRSLIGGR